MTTNTEQEFFKVFGINKQCMCPYFPEYKENGCEICIKYFQGKKDCNKKNRYRYPNITSGKLLEMICIVFNTFPSFEINRIYTVETLKDKILSLLILAKDDVYNQIQQLFEVKNEHR